MKSVLCAQRTDCAQRSSSGINGVSTPSTSDVRIQEPLILGEVPVGHKKVIRMTVWSRRCFGGMEVWLVGIVIVQSSIFIPKGRKIYS